MRYLICVGFLIFVGTVSITVSAQSPLVVEDAAFEVHTDNANTEADPNTIPSQSSESWVDGDAGAANAALFAVAILANEDADLRTRLEAFRAAQTQTARDMTVPPAL